MLIHEMTNDECLKALAHLSLGRLACASGGQPYVVPVYLAFDGKHLYGFSTLGKKIEWMRANPLVSVEIDDIKSEDQWTSIVVFGSYKELPDTPAYAAARKHAHELLRERTMWWQPAFVEDAHPGHPESLTPIFFRIYIDRVTGRQASPDRVEAETPLPGKKASRLGSILRRMRVMR
jgi:nitroimidazol reductase NimA-like FMN-containing flavoprotein (pyridoxamine 5'-phosphate oxidase superfamily)